MIKKSLIGFIPMILNAGTEYSEIREHRTQDAGFWTPRSLKTGSTNLIPRPCGVLVWVCQSVDTWLTDSSRLWKERDLVRTLLASLISRSIVVDNLEASLNSQNCGIAYIYFNSLNHEHQTALNVFASLLKQLAVRSKEKSSTLNTTYNRHHTRRTRPDLADLVDCIDSVCALFSASFIILDALDECEESHRRQVLKELSRLECKSVKVLATGRQHIAGLENFKFSSTIQVRADIHDLRRYLENKLTETTLENMELKERIVDVLSTKANGL
jgi:hypothetical protein